MKQLDKIKYGERFFYGDVAWVRIPCCSSTGALVIAEAPIFEWAFDIHNNNDSVSYTHLTLPTTPYV